MCVPDYAHVECDPATSVLVVDEDGVGRCESSGIGECGTITCKNPDPGKVTVCGQLVSVRDSATIATGGGTRCDSDTPPSSGPCAMSVRVFDALQFAANPSGAPELIPDELIVNSCGGYMAHNIPTPMLGFVAVVLDDHPGTGADLWLPSATVTPVIGGQRVSRSTSLVLAHATDALWTLSAGAPFGLETFVQRGAQFLQFLGPKTATSEPGDLKPIEGVTLLRGAVVDAANDWYFSDTIPYTRTTVSASQSATGRNGFALMVGSGSGTGVIGAQGGEPVDTALGQTGVPCIWPEGFGGESVPGVFVPVQRVAENSVTGENCE